MFDFYRTLPPRELMNHSTWGVFKNFGVQYSKLMAWTWLNIDLENQQDEQKLRKGFVRLLQKQATNAQAYSKCQTPPDVLDKAKEASKNIKQLLLGKKIETSDIETSDEKIIELAQIDLTLSEVLRKYTEQPLMTSSDGDEHVHKMFDEMFNVQVITDSFVGSIIYAPGKDSTSEDKDKYIIELAAPPRPVSSEDPFALVSNQVLETWINTPDDKPIKYAGPPSAYIPWSAS